MSVLGQLIISRAAPFADRSLFEKVRVDTGGYGLVWDDEIDLSVEDVWWDGQPVG